MVLVCGVAVAALAAFPAHAGDFVPLYAASSETPVLETVTNPDTGSTLSILGAEVRNGIAYAYCAYTNKDASAHDMTHESLTMELYGDGVELSGFSVDDIPSGYIFYGTKVQPGTLAYVYCAYPAKDADILGVQVLVNYGYGETAYHEFPVSEISADPLAGVPDETPTPDKLEALLEEYRQLYEDIEARYRELEARVREAQ
jgi:hypothetical protein